MILVVNDRVPNEPFSSRRDAAYSVGPETIVVLDSDTEEAFKAADFYEKYFNDPREKARKSKTLKMLRKKESKPKYRSVYRHYGLPE